MPCAAPGTERARIGGGAALYQRALCEPGGKHGADPGAAADARRRERGRETQALQ